MSFGLSAAAIGGIAAGVGAIGGAVISGNAAQSAANTQAQATQSQVAEQNYQFNTVQGLLKPYVDAGTGALQGYNWATNNYQNGINSYSGVLNQLNNLTGANGNGAQQTAINGLTSNPLYTSSMQLGQQAILANASATGGLRNGNTIASLGYLPNQILSNVMGTQIGNLGTSLNGEGGLLNALNQNINQYGNLVQQGESAAAGTGTAALSTGNNITSLIGQQGAIQAGGTLGTANAISSGLNNFTSYLGTNGGQGALASLLANAGGVGGTGANTAALATSTPQDLISGYTG